MKEEYRKIIDRYTEVNWEDLCENEKLSEDFTREFKDLKHRR